MLDFLFNKVEYCEILKNAYFEKHVNIFFASLRNGMNLPLDSLVCFHSLDPLLFKGGEVNFDYLTRRGGGNLEN